MRLLLLSVALTLLAILATADSASATKQFQGGYDILSISDSTLGGHGDVSQRFTSPDGDHVIAKATVQLDPNWDIAQVTDDSIVGDGALTVDVDCDGTPNFYPLTIIELGSDATDPAGVETKWVAEGYEFRQFPLLVWTDAGVQSVEIQLFQNQLAPHTTCTPLDLTLTFAGISTDNPDTGPVEGGEVVLTQPGSSGVKTWTTTMKSSPLSEPDPGHPLVTRCDQIAIGAASVTDTDADGIADACDNCLSLVNADQRDSDFDGVGDLCDTDDDGDGVVDASDLCPLTGPAGSPDPVDVNGCSADQVDQDGDGICDPGKTSSFCTGSDNCVGVSNPGQEDFNNNGVGDHCEDSDADGSFDFLDNCPSVSNLFQFNSDADGLGDACDPCPLDPDCDDDGLLDDVDPCPEIVDCDGDGWTDFSEVTSIGTDPKDDCADGPSDAAWPVDFDNDTFITSSDLSAVAAVIGQAVPPAQARIDIDPEPADLAISSGDLSQVAARIGQGCTP